MANLTKDFILAGRAHFTIVGRQARFTYRVTRHQLAGRPEVYFVSLLTGSDNTSNYSYLGVLDPRTGEVRPTRKTAVALDAPGFKALQWTLPKLFAGQTLPPALQVHHEGRCGRCARLLTVPESIESGFGPECAGKVGGGDVRRATKAKAPAARRVEVSRSVNVEHDSTPVAAVPRLDTGVRGLDLVALAAQLQEAA